LLEFYPDQNGIAKSMSEIMMKPFLATCLLCARNKKLANFGKKLVFYVVQIPMFLHELVK
jgi:hypothetical protein